jgi:hypothetical protein
MVSLFDKMKIDRKEKILSKANQFLSDHTK